MIKLRPDLHLYVGCRKYSLSDIRYISPKVAELFVAKSLEDAIEQGVGHRKWLERSGISPGYHFFSHLTKPIEDYFPEYGFLIRDVKGEYGVEKSKLGLYTTEALFPGLFVAEDFEPATEYFERLFPQGLCRKNTGIGVLHGIGDYDVFIKNIY